MAAVPSSIDLIYQGDLRGLAALVRVLRGEELDVWYDPPRAQYGEGIAQEIEVKLIVSAVGPAAKTLTANAVRHLRSRCSAINVRGRHETI